MKIAYLEAPLSSPACISGDFMILNGHRENSPGKEFSNETKDEF
jgi:hypothetical protein